MDDNDKSIMEIILQMRLSEMAVLIVSSNTSTQKVEAFNRAAVSTLSKETNFSRNFGGRLAAQVLKANNTVVTSVKRKLHVISGAKLSERRSHHLKGISKEYKYHKTYKCTGAYKKKRIATRARLEYEHHQHRLKVPVDQDYIKGQVAEEWHTYANPVSPGPAPKRKQVAQKATIAHLSPMCQGQISFQKIRTHPSINACSCYMKVSKGSNQKQHRKSENTIFPIISLWGYFLDAQGQLTP